MSNRPYVWKGGEETNKYDDIINLPHYVSATHPHMSMLDRAAQFSPFDALEGYSDEIGETARTTSERIELSETQMEELNRRINKLQEISLQAAHDRYSGSEVFLPTVTVTYFVPDTETNRHSKKSGGAYVTYTGVLRRVDLQSGIIMFQGKDTKNGMVVKLSDVTDITAPELFEDEP